jgi:hypothetical protein
MPAALINPDGAPGFVAEVNVVSALICTDTDEDFALGTFVARLCFDIIDCHSQRFAARDSLHLPPVLVLQPLREAF